MYSQTCGCAVRTNRSFSLRTCAGMSAGRDCNRLVQVEYITLNTQTRLLPRNRGNTHWGEE